MKTFLLSLLLAPTMLLAEPFSYQGKLDDGGAPANGNYDLRFQLLDASSSTASTVIGTIHVDDLSINNGVFTVNLDFGTVFDGTPYWLEIAVRPGNSTGTYTLLTPNQPILATPEAQVSLSAVAGSIDSAAIADGSITYGDTDGSLQKAINGGCATGEAIRAINADGTVACEVDDDTTYSAGFGLTLSGNTFVANATELQTRVGTGCNTGESIQHINADGTVVCEVDDDTTYSAGFGLTLSGNTFVANTTELQTRVGTGCGTGESIQSINADGTVNCIAVGGGTGGVGWSLSGNFLNATDFLGSINAQPVIIKTNNQPVVQYSYATDSSGDVNPNILAGSPNNELKVGIYGATVAGGGGDPSLTNCGDGTQACVNRASANYATVSGGRGNTASALYATIGGGVFNKATATGASVVAGSDNSATDLYTFIGGGLGNSASGFMSTVAGGNGNSASSGNYVTISGGNANTADGEGATIGGGANNTASSLYAHIGGGNNNTAGNQYIHIGGGLNNTANAQFAIINGGQDNTASGNFSFLGGGFRNQLSGNYAIILGGVDNVASGSYAVVAGGYKNQANASYSFAAGNRAIVRDATTAGNTTGDKGTFIWADSQAEDFVSTGPNQFLIRAAGGMGVGTNAPENPLHVQGNVPSGTLSPADHVAQIRNSQTASSNGLAITLGAPTPGNSHNFITFYGNGGTTAVGAIEGDGASGVNYKSGGADVAEFFPAEQVFEPGTVVGLKAGQLQIEIEDAEKILVISTAPMITGNSDMRGDRGKAPAALLGQVPVRVEGPVAAGDWLLAVGNGKARALKNEELPTADLRRVLGRALEKGENGRVRALVGLPLQELLALQQSHMQRQKDRITELERQLARMQQIQQQVLAQLNQLIPGQMADGDHPTITGR